MRIRVRAKATSCPTCGREIARQRVRFSNSFRCPFCHTRLIVGGLRARNLIATAIAFLLAFAVGVRGPWLVIVGFLGGIPIGVLVLVVSLQLFSVDLVPTGDVREILYPIEDSRSDPIADSGSGVPTTAESARPRGWIGQRAWELFVGINQPPSVEGFALQAGFLVLAVTIGWLAATPLLREVLPGFDTTRSGPRGFPISVQIGSWTIAFTNGSDTPWSCRAELGWRPPLTDTFEVAPGKTVPIELARFNPQGTLDDSQRRRAAQDRIDLECREPSGRTHSATLP